MLLYFPFQSKVLNQSLHDTFNINVLALTICIGHKLQHNNTGRLNMALQNPAVGAWYHNLAEDDLFEIVAIDEQFGTIEIQYLGGEVSELEIENWAQLLLTPAEAPEDAGAAFELSKEDQWDNDRPIIPENWTNPLSSIEPKSFTGFEDF